MAEKLFQSRTVKLDLGWNLLQPTFVSEMLHLAGADRIASHVLVLFEDPWDFCSQKFGVTLSRTHPVKVLYQFYIVINKWI